jgi:MinD-like ATPase involved in chromosome partitioning or flagellar assembly
MTADQRSERAGEQQLVESVRAPQPYPRVVALVSGSGGTGVTSTAIGIGLAFAAIREDATVVVDARSGTASIAAKVAGGTAPRVADIARDPWDAAPARSPYGLSVVDGAAWSTPTRASELSDALGVLTANHAFTLADVGNDRSPPALAALHGADQVVLVVNTTRAALDALATAVERLAEAAPDRLENLLVALVCWQANDFGRVMPHLRGADLARVVGVPYDRSLAGGGPMDPGRLSAATKRAYLTLAAMISESG